MTRGHYHGTTIWSWHQALLVAGLQRQQARRDLSPQAQGRLKAIEGQLWDAIDKGHALRNSELWSWDYKDGRIYPVPFTQGQGHKTESNAAQLWSTVYLAIQR